MKLGVPRNGIKLDPQLEALREKGLKESSHENNDWILRMINRTARIHAGFLFEDRKTLQNLCLFISETPNKITDPGWEAFGNHLGLSLSVLKVINYNNFNKEDPCYNTLLAYVQYDNASVGKIIQALFTMGRIDVLSRIHNSINELADVILNKHQNPNVSNNSIEETSDYESLPTNEDCSSSNSLQESIIKPEIIPPAPFIFQNLKAYPQFTFQQIQQSNVITSTTSYSNQSKESCCSLQNSNKIITCIDNNNQGFETKLMRETLQNSAQLNKENLRKSKKEKYGIKILLTFAEDGEKYVDMICKLFRKKRENYPLVGVLVLSEHTERVNKDPQQFISGSFYQVDYVCPILTTGYYNLIMKKHKATLLSNMHIDASYVPYIYKLMSSYFITNDCLNDKIRCIIPDGEFSSLPFNFLLTNPIFGAWVKLSEVDELVERLLKSNKKKSICVY